MKHLPARYGLLKVHALKNAKQLYGVLLCIMLLIPMASCDEESKITVPAAIDTLSGCTYDPVYNIDGGFIITYGMLDKRYNEITFPGTHNSAANHTTDVCENQGLGIWQQMTHGIRYIELDVNDALWSCHSGACSFHPINYHFERFKDFARNHPNQVITVRISDLCTGLQLGESYERLNGRLEDTGLDAYIYNWDKTKAKNDPRRCYIPEPWPTLREMIESGKNVMFFHNEKYNDHGVFDEGMCPSLKFFDPNLLYYFFRAIQLEQLCKLMPTWAPPQERQKNAPYRLFLIECDPDGNDPAGDKEYASKNNDGRKLYQLARQLEDEILPYDRAVNFIIVDYFMTTSARGGALPLDVVDACNRLNHERLGIDWENSDCFWELHPYEFSKSKTEYISQIPALRAELEGVIRDFRNKGDWADHHKWGMIVSTDIEMEYDWKRFPEWAVDNDLMTRWCGNYDPIFSATWGIDLGERKPVNEIAIAWEFIHKRPGYRVYASNDDGRFADGISTTELQNDDGWVPLFSKAMDTNNVFMLWDQTTFDGNGSTGWRYFKIKVTNADLDLEHLSSFWEVRLYGPSD